MQDEAVRAKAEAEAYTNYMINNSHNMIAGFLQTIITVASNALPFFTADCVRVTFTVLAHTLPGQDIFIVGNVQQQLGSWRVDRSIPLAYGNSYIRTV